MALVYFDVTKAIDCLQHAPEHLDFRSGWLIHLPTNVRFQLDADGLFITEFSFEFRSLPISPEQTSEFICLFRTWYDDYWRPAQVNHLLENHSAPQNGIEHFLRRLGWRRVVRFPPTSGELLGLPIVSSAPSEKDLPCESRPWTTRLAWMAAETLVSRRGGYHC
jgi:hypothetical protein